MGFDLSKNPYALNETIRILIRTIVPFLILVAVSYLTPAPPAEQREKTFGLFDRVFTNSSQY